MKALSDFDTFKIVAKATAKWCLFVSFSDADTGVMDEVYKAAPWLKNLDYGVVIDLVVNGDGIVTFDSEQECWAAFHSTVGDDGPTKTNPYKGPVKVYACVCDNTGVLLSENT